MLAVSSAMQLHHLIYESQATQPFTEAELAALLRSARINNEARGLSGLLLYAPEGRFLQVLEGAREVIHDLYFEHIARDPRHRDLMLLADGPLRRRRFTDWRMGFRNATAEALDEMTSHFSTADATFLLPMLPHLPSALIDKMLSYVPQMPADAGLAKVSH